MREPERDYQALRELMIQDQLVGRGITDQRVLRAMERVPRELFVPCHLRAEAYDDHPLPIGQEHGVQRLLRITRRSDRRFDRKEYCDVRFVPLLGQEGWS